MKKVLISIFGLVVLAGCSHYDYYRGGVRYTQDGQDCIYYADENGRRFSDEISYLNADKKVVYRNTSCAALYNKDMAGQAPRHDRKIMTPAAQSSACPCQTGNCAMTFEAPNYNCNTCAQQQPVLKRRYVIVSNM